MSSEVEITETPNWLKQLEANREQRLKARLGHEAGAGAPCLKCGDKCPGLDLHFWRKCCKICKCSKEEHEVHDDDIYGWAQFQLLGNKPNKIKSKIVLPGKKDEVELDWIPKGHKDTVEKYLSTLPADSLPVKGSRAARDRKQLLHKQIPVHDVDPALCHELNEDELRQMNEYVAHVKRNSVGVGQIVNLSSIIKGSLHVLNPSEAALIASRYPKGVPLSEIVRLQAQARSEGLSKKLERASLNERNLPDYKPKELAQLRDVQNPISPSKVHDKVYPVGTTDESAAQAPMYSNQLRSLNKPVEQRHPQNPSLDQYNSNYASRLITQSPNQTWTNYDSNLKSRPITTESLDPHDPNYIPKLLPEPIDQSWLNYDPQLERRELFNPNHPSYTPKLLAESLDETWPEYDPIVVPRPMTSELLGPNASKLPHNQNPASSPNRQDPTGQTKKPKPVSLLCQAYEIKPTRLSDSLDPNFSPRRIQSHDLTEEQISLLSPKLHSPKRDPAFDPNSDPRQVPDLKGFLETRASAFVPYNKAKPGHVPQVSETVEGTKHGRNLPAYAPGKYNVLTEEQIPTNVPRNMKDVAFSTYDPNRIDVNVSPAGKGVGSEVSSDTARVGNTPSKHLSQLRPRNRSVSEDFLQPSQVSIGAIQDINYPEIKAAVQGTNDFYEDYSPESIREILNNVKLPDCHYCKKPFEENEFAVAIERANALFHAECFRCAGCNQILADNVYFYSKETDNIYCGRDYAKIRGFPRCKACDELIFTKEYCLAENSTFHLKHFCCIECDTTLAGRDYTLEEGMPYCLPCFEHSKASKCNSCQRVIKPDEVGCNLNGVHFHADEQCFACKMCKTPLMGKKLLLRNQRLYCSHECFGKDA